MFLLPLDREKLATAIDTWSERKRNRLFQKIFRNWPKIITFITGIEKRYWTEVSAFEAVKKDWGYYQRSSKNNNGYLHEKECKH